MDRWINRVAVVTGASGGIGARIAIDLVKAGIKVVALARREDKLAEIRKTLPDALQANLHPKKCDITNEDEVRVAFDWVEEHLGGTDILVNNAGRLHDGHLTTLDTKRLREVVDLNIMGVVYCTQQAFRSMKKRKYDGHVILINSRVGHEVPSEFLNIYAPTKYAVTAMADVFRQEFQVYGTKVKTTSISPGQTDTEMISDDFRSKASGYMLESEDVSNAVLYVLSTPPHVQVYELSLRNIFETKLSEI